MVGYFWDPLFVSDRRAACKRNGSGEILSRYGGKEDRRVDWVFGAVLTFYTVSFRHVKGGAYALF